MDIISAKVAQRGVISLPTQIIQELNNQVLSGIRDKHRVIPIYWDDIGITAGDDDAIGYALEVLVDAGYEVVPFYIEDFEFTPSGAIIGWGKEAGKLIDLYFTEHDELYRE